MEAKINIARIILCLHLICFALKRTEIGEVEVKLTQPCGRLRNCQTLDPSLILHISEMSRCCSSGPQWQEKIGEPLDGWCRLRCGFRILQQWTLGTVYFHSSSRAPLARHLWTLYPSLLNHSTSFINSIYALIWYYYYQHLQETTHWKLWFLHVTLKLQRYIHFRKILGKGLLILNLRAFPPLSKKKKKKNPYP